MKILKIFLSLVSVRSVKAIDYLPYSIEMSFIESKLIE